jgi:hypothetical protein
MQRILTLSLCLACSCLLFGCEDTNKVKREIKIDTPRGTTTIETEHTEKKTDPSP